MCLCAFPLRYLTSMVFSTTDLNDEKEGGKFLKSNVLMLKKEDFFLVQFIEFDLGKSSKFWDFSQIKFSFT